MDINCEVLYNAVVNVITVLAILFITVFFSITMVADNCHSSKRHKFVNFRLNFNYFELKMK